MNLVAITLLGLLLGFTIIAMPILNVPIAIMVFFWTLYQLFIKKNSKPLPVSIVIILICFIANHYTK
jgi:hydrogenase/urease accessory protein HupE